MEQNADLVLLNFKRQMLGVPVDEKILATNPRYIHSCRNKKRIISKNDILYEQYFNNVCDVSHLKVLLPVQLKEILLNSLHGRADKHPGSSKIIQEIRQKYYFPSIANHVRKWVKKCQTCVKDKRIDNPQITPELISKPEWDLVLEDIMQIDLLPELPPNVSYENIITAIDVFSTYGFAYHVPSPKALNTAKVFINIMTRHSYLPAVMKTDKGSVFISNVIQERAEVLGITLAYGTTKNAQTIGVLERTHATIKTSLGISSR